MSNVLDHQRQASTLPDPPARGAQRPSVLDLWATMADRDDACGNALGQLLLARPELVHELYDHSTAADHLRRKLTEELAQQGRTGSPAGSWLAATALLLDSAGRRPEALALCREVVPRLIETCPADPSCLRLIERLLRKPGVQDAPSLALFLQLRSASMMAHEQPGGEMELRGMALEAFVNGRLEEAERIYRHLMARGFEPAGTRAHLARILIALGREQEAGPLLHEAWDYRAAEPTYIAGRVAFLQALLAALAGADASTPLRRLKEIIGHPGIAMDWTMTPVLLRVAARLSDEHRELFAALLGVLGSSHGLAPLEALPAWRRVDGAQSGGT